MLRPPLPSILILVLRSLGLPTSAVVLWGDRPPSSSLIFRRVSARTAASLIIIVIAPVSWSSWHSPPSYRRSKRVGTFPPLLWMRGGRLSGTGSSRSAGAWRDPLLGLRAWWPSSAARPQSPGWHWVGAGPRPRSGDLNRVVTKYSNYLKFELLWPNNGVHFLELNRTILYSIQFFFMNRIYIWYSKDFQKPNIFGIQLNFTICDNTGPLVSACGEAAVTTSRPPRSLRHCCTSACGLEAFFRKILCFLILEHTWCPRLQTAFLL